MIVACGLIDPPNDACKIKPKKVARLVKSIEANGLLQPPGVVAVEARYRIVYGNHRLHAWRKLGHSKIEVRVLSADTSAEQELSISLQENHVREDEDFFDTLARVEKRAKQRDCTFKEAAKLEDVNHAYVSRVKRIAQIDEPVLEKATANEVGFSVLYAISGTKNAKHQGKYLDAYLAGSMNREAIEKSIKGEKAAPPAKRLNLKRATELAEMNLKLDAEATHEDAIAELDSWKKDLKTDQQNGIPLKRFNEIKRKGKQNVVQKA
jgi:ParB/RepB/Spo0J family partition protein